MMRIDQSQASSREARQLRRKVSLSRWSLYLERLWPRLWVVVGIIAIFILTSIVGVWQQVSEPVHWLLLGGFAVALLAAIGFVFMSRYPSQDEAIRMLERRSGVPHRPAATYDDSLTGAEAGSATAEIWRAHKERLSRDIEQLEVSVPRPNTASRDPIALRALMLAVVVAGLAWAGDGAYDRLQSAFRFASLSPAAGARLDAWVTPPHYTGQPPVLLADGSKQQGGNSAGSPVETEATAIRIPDKSIVIVRIGGAPEAKFRLEFVDPNGDVLRKLDGAKPKGGSGEIIEVSGVLDPRVTGVRLRAGERDGEPLASWQFNVIPDLAPTIKMTKELEKTRRGAMKLYYRIEDDYGVASAEAKFERMPLDPADPKTSWARKEILKGPRPPLARPPKVVLRLPARRAKSPETWSFHELGSHPWAGMPVRMTLVARDHAGNIGRSETKEIVLPERLFFNPFARAVVEQRRKLVYDPRYRPLVLKALDALTTAPEQFVKDKSVYLGLRSVYYRLRKDKSRRTVNSAIDQLWHVALRIENGGGLSGAEQRLRELQEKLAKALERGASNEEISRLMQQLRQALNEFLQQLQRQAQNAPAQQRQNQNPNQFMRPQDLNRMLNQLEQMAKQGSKQMAQEMLSQLRDLLDRLQSGRMVRQNGQQNGRGQQMMQMLNQFGDLIGKQQRLMDDTHGQRRQQGQRGQEGQQGQGQRGQGNQQQGRSGQGQQGQGQQGQGPRAPGQRPGNGRAGNGRGGLEQRQGQLGQRLQDLQQGLQRFGLQSPDQLGRAGEAMENARRALEQGDLGEATREQSRALEALRQGSRQLAGQMMRRMPQRYGRGPGQRPPSRDPLGRARNDLNSQGDHVGTNVKVPEEIDMQRAREILNELRRRLGERFRPEMELQYLERLLRRF